MIYKVTDKIPDICCKGYSWEIIDIAEGIDDYRDYWGRCDNPNCNELCTCGESNCDWNRISTKDSENVEEWMYENRLPSPIGE